MKPRIHKHRGWWWVSCKHGQRTGPYGTLAQACLAAAMLWEAYGG